MRMDRTQFLLLVAITAMAIAATERASAQAVLMPMVNNEIFIPPPPPPPVDHTRRIPPSTSALPFRIVSSQVHVRIDENVATTTMEQSFQNLSGQNLEVRVMIPLPNGASVNSSSLSMNGSMIEGQLHNAQEAQNIYESIVVRRKDPSLLRFAGENMYEARIFPVAPNEEKKFKFSYTQLLTQDGGLYDLRHILSGSQLYQSGVENFSLDVTIHSKNAIGPVYSPSHKVQVDRPDENTASIKLSGTNIASDHDFRLLFAPAPAANEVAMRLLTHRGMDGEDGYFMLVGRADSQLQNVKVIPKEIVLVLDISGSMQGEKMDQARAAMKFCLNSLNEHDRFNFISFSTDVTVFANNLLPATKENIKKAVATIEQLEASGGTNIDGALRAAFANDFTDGAATSKMIVFMTDGLPTVGVTDPESILQTVQTSNKKNKIRFFNFGVGNDVNTHFMDILSNSNDGVTSYVAPREDIEVKVSDFYNKIRNPFMTDVTLDYGDEGKANSIYPRKIAALYRGSEFVLVGRFKGTGPSHITLSGNVGGEQKQIHLDVTWPSREVDNAFLPRVWAMRKVGHLMEDLRLHGSNPEIVNELVALAQRHGIVTPYTSQLVVEPDQQIRPPNTPQPMPILRGGGRGGGDDTFGAANAPTAKPMDAAKAIEANVRTKHDARAVAETVREKAQQLQSGDVAVALATAERELKDADSGDKAGALNGLNMSGEQKKSVAFDKLARKEEYRRAGAAMRADGRFAEGKGAANAEESDELIGKQLEEAQAAAVKQIGSRTFYNNGGVWVDSTAKPDAKPTVIKLFSKEYFELIKADTTLGAVLALGGKIVVVSQDKTYQVEE
jgi:Ca-activated chloride channel family protein